MANAKRPNNSSIKITDSNRNNNNNMRKAKSNMFMHGFVLLSILATAKSAEAEITIEAAFQGHCGHTSPCEQLCYEIHDGMYECDCIEGYELNKNGYSCQVINSTNSSDGHSKSDEDVLYQKGALFSAKLANGNGEAEDSGGAGDLLSPQYDVPADLARASSNSASLSSEELHDDSNYLDVGDNNGDDYDDNDDLTNSKSLKQQSKQPISNSNDYYISQEHNNYNYNNNNNNINDPYDKYYNNYDVSEAKRDDKNNNNNNNNNNNDQDNYYEHEKVMYNMQQHFPKALSLLNYHNKNKKPVDEADIDTWQRYHLRQQQQPQQQQLMKTSTITKALTATATTAAKESILNVDDGKSLNDAVDVNDYYVNQDMFVYDDVNNNQLNSRPLSHLTYQPPSPLHKQQQQQQHQHMAATMDNMNTRIDTRGSNSYTLQQTLNNNEATSTVDGYNSPYKINAATTASNSNSSRRSGTNSINNNNRNNNTKQSLMSATDAIANSNYLISTNISLDLSKLQATTTESLCGLDCGVDGICLTLEHAPHCLCPFGKTGHKCLEDVKVRIPKFSKHSWMAFAALRGAYKHVQLRVEFRPESFNGIILLSSERDDLTGDFMALLLNKGFVEFWFDCGSGMGSVRSHETILLNEWNSVTIYRYRWDAWLVLNRGSKVQGRSNGLFSRITFREPVFLGGTGNITGLSKRLPITQGFVGCVRRFVANTHDYRFLEHPLGDVIKGFDIQDCATDKCFKYPCQHGGKCFPSDQGAMCLCPMGFVGDLCEIRMDLQVILKPENSEGLILYSGSKHLGDFIALVLTNGFVEFIFDLGSGAGVVRSAEPLTIGQWHTIRISRIARLAVLKVDQLPEAMTISSNGFWHLSLPDDLFVGGVNRVDKLPLNLKSKAFLNGCIQRIEINGHSLAIISEALGGSNVGNCPHACVARPCGPLAECVPQMESYECSCSVYNTQCREQVVQPRHKVSVKDKNNKRATARTHFIQHRRDNVIPHNDKQLGVQESLSKKSQRSLTKLHPTWHLRQQQLHQYGVGARQEALPFDITTTTTSITTSTTNLPTTTTLRTARQSINWQPFKNGDTYPENEEEKEEGGYQARQKEIEETLKTLSENGKAMIFQSEDSKDTTKDNVEQTEEEEDLDELEDEIIFENVKALLDRKNEVEQRQHMLPPTTQSSDNYEAPGKIGQESILSRSRIRNKQKKTKPIKMKSHYSNINPHSQRLHPHHKASPLHKLSRIPTHYESFQANTGSDILTFEDPVILETELRKYSQPDTIQIQNDEEVHDAEKGKDDDDEDDDGDVDETDLKIQNSDDNDSQTFAMDQSLFDENDSTEEYQRKQLRQDMQRIMANTKGPYIPKIPKLVISEYDYSEEDEGIHTDVPLKPNELNDEMKGTQNNNADNDLIAPVHNEYNANVLSTTGNDKDDEDDEDGDSDIVPSISKSEIYSNKFTSTISSVLPTSTQTHTDWSLLSKFDLSSDQPHHTIGVHKNVGACFAGQDSYFHYNDAATMSQIISYTIDLNLRIKTRSENGVILWTGKVGSTDRDSDDYLSLGTEKGYLHFRYNLGSGEVNIRFNGTKISDGLWHRVRAIRNSQEGHLEVDSRKSNTLRSPGKLRQLNTDTGLYVGGMPDVNYFTRQRYNNGIVGCISEIVLAGELKMSFDPNTVGTAHNVETGLL